jgi:predicted permease
LRWSWGYHVLLAPKERYLDHTDHEASRIEQGQAEYTDNPEQSDPDEPLVRTGSSDGLRQLPDGPQSDGSFPSGEQTPVTARTYSFNKLSDEDEGDPTTVGPHGKFPHQHSADEPAIGSMHDIRGFQDKRLVHRWKHSMRRSHQRAAQYWEKTTETAFSRLPFPMQKVLSLISLGTWRFFHGVWDFMNPPLWAMLVSIVVASVPALQELFFDEGTFVRNSVTMAIKQNGQVAVPLILVVLGANLARNTLPKEALEDVADAKEERNLIIAALVARMLLPTLTMAPILAVVARYLQVSILDDPIFIIVCFLLTGAPSALQLAQICQLNNVYVGAMSRLLFQSYVVWYVRRVHLIFLANMHRILPSTLVLVMCALEVLEWASVAS